MFKILEFVPSFERGEVTRKGTVIRHWPELIYCQPKGRPIQHLGEQTT